MTFNRFHWIFYTKQWLRRKDEKSVVSRITSIEDGIMRKRNLGQHKIS